MKITKTQIVTELVPDDWYAVNNPGVDLCRSALADYLADGWREGRQPNFYFDPRFYRASDEAGEHGNPLLDYIDIGEPQGRPPSCHFDPVWYRARNGAKVGRNALAHYLRHRFTGQVSPNPDFDSDFYLRQYPDIRRAGVDPYEHFIQTGRREFRLPRPERELLANSGLFDLEYYLFSYEDVRRAAIDPIDHYIGQRGEHRKPSFYFDSESYDSAYGSAFGYSCLAHYLLIGEDCGHVPSRHFDPGWYRRTHLVPNGRSALADYLARRKEQTVSPAPDFDIATYSESLGPSTRPGRDLYLHFLTARAIADSHGGNAVNAPDPVRRRFIS